ncbi:MAG TPA: WXG100 family type VII secretion target [Phycisphaerae bacterium]|nr:WXG100 family type VII secretion target [Phycisphaerae bacterium]
MARANVDPAELRRFARDLSRFSGELQTMMAGLHARAQDLATSWRDQEQAKFAEEMDQAIRTLARFLESANRHVAFLNKKAAHVEEYLKQR